MVRANYALNYMSRETTNSTQVWRSVWNRTWVTLMKGECAFAIPPPTLLKSLILEVVQPKRHLSFTSCYLSFVKNSSCVLDIPHSPQKMIRQWAVWSCSLWSSLLLCARMPSFPAQSPTAWNSLHFLTLPQPKIRQYNKSAEAFIVWACLGRLKTT